MSIENLFLTQQQQETQRNYERQLEKEQKRRERGGLFSSIGGGLGGFLGALALAPFTGGASLLGSAALGSAALTGLGATAGSLIGSRAGLELGGGKRSDAVDLGMNRDALTGDLKEFSQSVKDRLKGEPVRFVYDKEINSETLKFLLSKMNINSDTDSIIPGGKYHNRRDYMNFPNLKTKLTYKKIIPLNIVDFNNNKSVFETLDKKYS